ncbi:hypothetical protein SLS60_002493 [Paraconiothyrium brasiliense]|uniref:Uncharacterized protein n=1 Tax=Paraconiothyrium brasiliense TaxID=300254 RepID=A0ABR3S2G1_9PLEO
MLAAHIRQMASVAAIPMIGRQVRSAAANIDPTDGLDKLLGEHPWDLTVRFDGSLSRDSSPFKGPPSKEVDKRWEDLVPRKLILSLLERNAVVTAKQNTHYPDFYTEEAKFAKEHRDEWLEHVDHCVDMLRQKLMCDADSGLITYSWLKNHYNPHPNFNVQHKCRDYDRLLDASAKHGFDMERLPKEGVRRPEHENVVDFVEPPFDPLAE